MEMRLGSLRDAAEDGSGGGREDWEGGQVRGADRRQASEPAPLIRHAFPARISNLRLSPLGAPIGLLAEPCLVYDQFGAAKCETDFLTRL